MPNKTKKRILKNMKIDPHNPDTKLQLNIPKGVDEAKKVKESDVFEKPKTKKKK
tara:strand:- start:396 stop:557 length:162 start_codon:yes stop_codon:yes gene_type:complete